MTRIENALFDINERLFGQQFAVWFYCRCSDAFTALMYMLYLTSLPYEFVWLFVQNFRTRMFGG